MKAVLIQPEGTTTLPNVDPHSYESIQEHVGGYYELYRADWNDLIVLVCIDGDGRPKELPANPYATKLLSHLPPCHVAGPIVGPALFILAKSYINEEYIDATDEFVEFVRAKCLRPVL